MEGPLSVVFKFGHGMEMLVALFVGIGFGFVLERGGFGRADNLAAIFYGRDFRVLRVMFSAIVTGMLGLYFMDLLGIMPLSSIGILDTWLLPQLVGGLLLGAGFIIGGYCPGTSIVALSSGKMDAALFLLGMLAGTTMFTLGYDTVEPFHKSTSMGRVLLHEALGVPSGVMVFGVSLMAIGAFWFAGKAETWVNGKRGAP